jgi:rhamnulokinase
MGNNGQTRGTRCAAIDLGAGSGRLIIGEFVNSALVLSEQRRFATPIECDATTGYQCWNLDAIEAHIRDAIGRAAAQAPIASVGVDSWGVDYVLLDGGQSQVGKAVCYRDKRAAGVMERFQERISAAEIYRRTGIQFLPFNTLYQLAATADQNPQWLDAAEHLLMIPDYFHFRLCGVISNEYTNSTTTQMLGLDGAWDTTLLEAAGIRKKLMLPPADAATVLGNLQTSRGWAKVIAPASHDTASAVAGAPLESEDEAYISSGTWSLMGIESRLSIASPEAMQMNFTNEGGLERRYRVLKNIAGMWPLQRLCHEYGAEVNGQLVADAQRQPAWQSIVTFDHARFLNPDSMGQEIRRYCQETGQQEPVSMPQLARCVFDSLALSYRKVKEELETLRGKKLTKIHVIGGGSRNDLLNQLCADACQLPVCAGPVEASALGNLCAQMIALGDIENLEAARQIIRHSFPLREFRPQASIPDGPWRSFLQLVNAPDSGV